MLFTAMYVVKERSERYETVDTLAEGSMGSVLLARDRLMDRFVAIKAVRLAGVDDAAERQRLEEALRLEAQVIQLLSHPNIVSVFEIIDAPGSQTPALVMEYVQGSTLEAYLKGGKPLPHDFALSVAAQVARALEHAHATGVVHGDVKPSNILIADDGETVKITDFGIARLMHEKGGAGRPFLGTPRYVSPEQIQGLPADPRSDLFSLGVVLYEMLTGRSPFTGQDAREVTRQIAQGQADLAFMDLHQVSPVIQSVVRRALTVAPDLRFQTAVDMASALENRGATVIDDDTVATQDLSALVVPELPDVSVVTGAGPEVNGESAARADRPDPPPASAAAIRADPHPWKRWLLIALAASVPSLLTGLLLIRMVTPAEPPDGRFSEHHLTAAEIMPLFKEGRRQMLEGQPEVAARLFRRARGLAPASSDLARSLAEAEQAASEQQQRQLQTEAIESLLTDSRAALDAGRTELAARYATQALSLEPENPQAQALLEAASVQKPRRTSRRPERRNSDPTPEPTRASPTRTAPATPTSRPQANPSTPPEARTTPVRSSPPVGSPGNEATTADLRVDVFSYLSKGVLTVYADQDQVLLQPFRFVQKSGFMRKKKTAGRLETSMELPSGPTEFRIYISADGQETQTVSLAANLSGGQTHVLRLIIAENGSASAQLN